GEDVGVGAGSDLALKGRARGFALLLGQHRVIAEPRGARRNRLDPLVAEILAPQGALAMVLGIGRIVRCTRILHHFVGPGWPVSDLQHTGTAIRSTTSPVRTSGLR